MKAATVAAWRTSTQRGQEHPIRAAVVGALDKAVAVGVSLLWMKEERMHWSKWIPVAWAIAMVGCMAWFMWRDSRPKPPARRGPQVEVLGTFHPKGDA